MKKIIFSILLTSSLFTACFKVDESTDYGYLTPISVTAVSDTINVSIGQTLSYNGMTVKSDLPVSYEWVYGLQNATGNADNPTFKSKTLISTTPTIDYTFNSIGRYLLRCRMDNGESIEYKYFTLNVNSGFDEGVAILSNDAEGNAAVSFLKPLTADDIASGEQEFYYNIFEGYSIKNGTDMFMSDNAMSIKDKTGASTTVNYGAFLVATADEDGTIYQFEPKTTELFTTVKFRTSYNTTVKSFGGEYAASGGFANYLLGADGNCYRYDMQVANINILTDLQELGRVEHSFGAVNRASATSASKQEAWFFNKDSVYVRASSSAGAKFFTMPGYTVVNVASKRTASSSAYIYALFVKDREAGESDTDPLTIKIQSGGSGTWGKASMSTPSTFTVDRLCMDSNSRIVNTLASNDVYYTFDNAIYRWGLTTAPSSSPAITVPDGELIRDINVNFKGKAKGTAGEDLLYVVTYNPSRASAHKGSLYVYDIATQTLVKSFEGVFDDPVRVIYKYRLN